MKNNQKGFTLLELLVVVAIIGLLATVVVVSLNSARGKGGDAGVKTNLLNIRGQAEILNTTWGSYAVDATPTYFALAQCANTADTMFSDSIVWTQVIAAYTAGNGASNTRCVSTSNAWAVAVGLKSGGTAGDAVADSWCVDSAGTSKSYTWTAGQTIANSISGSACI